MSEIRTNLTISGDNLEYRCKISISVITLDTNLVDTQSSFRTNLNIESSNYSTKTILELNNERLDFYLVDVNKIKKTILYFSNILNTNFEPELLWSLLEQNTNEQINISHLTETLKYYLKKEDYEEVINILEEHITNNIIHISQQEREFIEDIMINKPWEGMSPGGGGSEVSYTPIVTSGEHIGNIIINGRIYKIYSPKPNLNGYATEQWVKDQKYLTQHQDISHLLSKTEATNTYATIESLNNTSQIITNIGIILNDWFTLEEVGGEKVLKTKYNLASEKAISWRGVSTSGGGGTGGGLIQRVYGYDNIADVFDDSIKTDTFNAHTIAKIAERVSDIEKNGVGGDVDLTGYATEDWVLNQNYLTSVSFSEILNKPTTLAGYGITDALSNAGGKIKVNELTNETDVIINSNATSQAAGIIRSTSYGIYLWNQSNGRLGILEDGTPHYNRNTLLHEGNFNSYALPKSGGTINGDLTIGENSASTTTQYYLRMWKEEGGQRHRAMLHVNADGTHLSYYNTTTGAFTKLVLGANTHQLVKGSTIYDIIHSGNIGSYNAGGIIGKLWSEKTTPNLLTTWDDWNNEAEIGYGSFSYGIHSVSKDFNYQFLLGADALRDGLFFKRKSSTWGAWKTVAFTDSNVASATKLQTARTIWGQSFDGTEDINSSLSFRLGQAALAAPLVSGGESKIFLQVNPSNNVLLGQQVAQSGYDTYIYGNNIRLCYGQTGSISNTAILVNPSGNILIGTPTDNGNKLQVAGSVSVGGDISTVVAGTGFGVGPTVTFSIQDRGKVAAIKGQYDNVDWSSSNPASGSLRFYTSQYAEPTEKMCITSGGNVLIGTTTDNGEKLQVAGNIAPSADETYDLGLSSYKFKAVRAKFLVNSDVYLGSASNALGADYTGGIAYMYGNNPFYIYTNTTARMIVTGNGNVGIATTSPQYRLDVNGSIKINNSIVVGFPDGSTGDILTQTAYGYSQIGYNHAVKGYNTNIYGYSIALYASNRSTPRVTILDNGNVLIGTPTDNGNKLQVNGNISATGSISWGAASDRRLKDNIKTISNEDAINVIMSLNPVTFEWNKTATEKDNSLKGLSCGFIADEYTRVIPNSSRPIWEEYDAIDYKLTEPYVVKGLQSHEERLRVLERENKELKQELNKLKGYGYR